MSSSIIGMVPFKFLYKELAAAQAYNGEESPMGPAQVSDIGL